MQVGATASAGARTMRAIVLLGTLLSHSVSMRDAFGDPPQDAASPAETPWARRRESLVEIHLARDAAKWSECLIRAEELLEALPGDGEVENDRRLCTAGARDEPLFDYRISSCDIPASIGRLEAIKEDSPYRKSVDVEIAFLHSLAAVPVVGNQVDPCLRRAPSKPAAEYIWPPRNQYIGLIDDACSSGRSETKYEQIVRGACPIRMACVARFALTRLTGQRRDRAERTCRMVGGLDLRKDSNSRVP